MSKCGVFSGPYFPALGLNTGKYGLEKTPYLDTIHAVNMIGYCLMKTLNWNAKKNEIHRISEK